jgi:hypothetical protein
MLELERQQQVIRERNDAKLQKDREREESRQRDLLRKQKEAE